MRHKKLHHGNAMTDKGGSHQRAVAALVHVRAVIDHPFRHGESVSTWRCPWNPALGNPSERAVFSVTERGLMQRRIASHKRLNSREIVRINGLLKPADFFERI